MIKTLDFTKLREQSEDVFELVVASSKRANMINALRVEKYPLPTLGKDLEETFNETPEEDDDVEWDELEKPVTLALNEMVDRDIDFRYASEEFEERVISDDDEL